jgi:mannan endo-1,4-beta-mannosidase
MRQGKPYYFVGTNLWYGAILGSEGQGGNRQRLCRELDDLKAIGIDNLRILVGSDGERGVKTKAEPTLQIAPGIYNDTLFAGLDYLLMEMGKRQMVAVLYLNNSWEWSGGYGFYLEHAGEGKAPRPEEEGYPAYMNFVSKFSTNEKAHQLFYQYVKDVITRTNQYTGKPYTDDPAIMSWQIGNEPRAFTEAAKQPFARWLAEASALIKQIDRNHLVSIGSEGKWGCEGDMALYEQICSDPNIDYMNIHLWPYNWNWAHQRTLRKDLQQSCENTKAYIDEHVALANQLNKPLVMEEFGFPRDGFSFSQESTTSVRDAYYKYVFSLVADNALKGGRFAGCNFWGWGGRANPEHDQWQPGDDYTGDPAQEQQGLNSVFSTDQSTLKIIQEQIQHIVGTGKDGM